MQSYSLVIIILLLVVTTTRTQLSPGGVCVQPQYIWRNMSQTSWPSALQNATLCGSDWYALMRLELLNLPLPEWSSAMWFVTFHQVCAAALNQARISEVANAPPPSLLWQTLVEVTLDSLERACANTSDWSTRWRYDPTLATLFTQLGAFNRGQILPQYPSCEPVASTPAEVTSPSPVTNATTLPILVSYTTLFGNLTDLFLIVLPNNETVAAGSAFFHAILAQTIQVKTLLILFSGFSLVLLLIVGVMWAIVLKNKKRENFWRRAQRDDARDDTTVQLDDTAADRDSTA